MPALSERDMRVLAFERGTWRTAGAKEQAIGDVRSDKASPASDQDPRHHVPRKFGFRDKLLHP